MRWTLAPVTLTALLATSAAADECAVYRAAIDDLSATRPTFEAVDLAIKFASRAMSAANETREPSNSASALMPAFNAARATVRASGDVFQYVDMIAGRRRRGRSRHRQRTSGKHRNASKRAGCRSRDHISPVVPAWGARMTPRTRATDKALARLNYIGRGGCEESANPA